MAKKFLGGAFYPGEAFNIYAGWTNDENELPRGRFAMPIRNKRGKVVGYTEHTGPQWVSSFGAMKAARKWDSTGSKLRRAWKAVRFWWAARTKGVWK